MCAGKDGAMLQMLRPVGAPGTTCVGDPPAGTSEEAQEEPCLAPRQPFAQGRETKPETRAAIGAHHVPDMQKTPVPPDTGVQMGFPR